MLGALPMRQAIIHTRVPIVRHLCSLQYSSNAALREEDAGMLQVEETKIVGIRHAYGVTGPAIMHAEGLEPVETETCLGIIACVFLAQDFLTHFIDESNC